MLIFQFHVNNLNILIWFQAQAGKKTIKNHQKTKTKGFIMMEIWVFFFSSFIGDIKGVPTFQEAFLFIYSTFTLSWWT